MADVTIKYKGNTIAEMSESGTKTLTTSGKYCEGNFEVSYSPAPATTETNYRVYDLTFTNQPPAATWIPLVEVDSVVKQHINDPTFTAIFTICEDTYAYSWYSGSCYIATNTPIAMEGTNPVYGYSNRVQNETLWSNSGMYHPANYTGTSIIGGLGAFNYTGSHYRLKPTDGFIRAGKYKLIFTW